MNAPDEIARKIIDLNANRSNVADKMWTAWDFAKAHSFEAEFKRRIDHLWRIANNQQHRPARG
jgi:hypothetical protein